MSLAVKRHSVIFHYGQMSCSQMSLAVKGPTVKCHLRSSFSNLGCQSKILRSNVTAVKCPAVKRHWRSKVPRSNVTCGQVFLILVASQKSRGQMSLAVKCPAVKCHLWSNVPRSNVTAVKCPAVKCHLRSNVPRSNVTCGQMSRGQMSLWSYVTKS